MLLIYLVGCKDYNSLNLEELNKEYEKAVYEKNDKEKIKILTIILNKSESANDYIKRGNAYLVLKEYSNALQDYDKSVKMDKSISTGDNYYQRYIARGYANLLLNNYDQALSDFNAGIKSFEEFHNKMYFIAKDTTKMVTATPEIYFLIPLLGRGITHLRKKNYSDAVSDFKGVIERQYTPLEFKVLASFWKMISLSAQESEESARIELRNVLNKPEYGMCPDCKELGICRDCIKLIENVRKGYSDEYLISFTDDETIILKKVFESIQDK